MEQNFKYIKILLNLKKQFKNPKQIFFSYNNILEYIKTQEDSKNILNYLDSEAININSKNQIIIHKESKSIKKNKKEKKLIFIEDYIKELQKNKDILNLIKIKEYFPGENYPLFYTEEFKKNELLNNPDKLIIEIQFLIKTLKANSISPDGTKVNYKKIKINSENFQKLITLLPFINSPKLFTQDKAKKSFFINLYNILNIHTIAHYFQKNPSEKKISKLTRLKFFKKYYYNIGGLNYTLDDIEHGILRKNNNFGKKFFKTFFDYICNNSFDDKSELRFKKFDPKKKFVIEKFDSRIHFALNCGALSCPPIRAFTEEKIESELDLACFSFVNQDFEFHVKNDVFFFSLSSLFDWYRNDFEGTLAFLKRFLDQEKEGFAVVKRVLDEGKKFKLVFKDYDWTLNSGDF